MKRLLWVGGMAGLAIAPAAFGQSSVTMYGIVDSAIQMTDFKRAGAGNMVTVVSGDRYGSRWGLRGAEDLGGGVRVIFQLEQGFSINNGMLGQGGRAFGRQAYVGLDGRFGTLAMGRISSFDGGAFDMFSEIDPFVSGYGVASLASTFTAAGGLRLDNAVLYRTPKLAGFQVGALHSFQASGQALPGMGANTRADDFGVSFRSGPFYAAVTYLVARFPSAQNFKAQQMLYLGATYDFKLVKLHAAYGIEKGVRSDLFSAVGNTADGTDAKSWMVGVSVPIGAFSSVRAGVQRRNGESESIGTQHYDANRTVYGLGYEYYLSKRTTFYASVAMSRGSGTLQTGTPATDFANKTEYTLGITHLF